MDRDDVEKLLARGMLLDGAACRALLDMGYGEHIGIDRASWRNKNDQPLSAELLHDEEFGGGENVFMSLTRICGNERFLACELLPDAREISCFVDPDRTRRFPGMCLYENRLGGRTAVYPVDLSSGVSFIFLNWARKRQLHAAVRWLNGGHPMTAVNNLPLVVPIVKEYRDRLMIGLSNLGTDDWPVVELVVPDGLSVEHVHVLAPDGAWVAPAWREAQGRPGLRLLRLEHPLKALDVAAVNVSG
jgi:hypothetical protein